MEFFASLKRSQQDILKHSTLFTQTHLVRKISFIKLKRSRQDIFKHSTLFTQSHLVREISFIKLERSRQDIFKHSTLFTETRLSSSRDIFHQTEEISARYIQT